MPFFLPEFFEPEVRSGYFISEKMKRFWAASIEVLHTVKSIAEKHGLTIYADFGTLLGVVRHGGFIPWDDDIDVSMLRSEYQQLMKILPAELPAGYVLYDHIRDNVPYTAKAFVANSTVIDTSAEFMERHHGCPLVTGIDIFPIDTIPDDEELWNTQKALYNAVYDAAFSYDKYTEESSIEEYLDQLEELLNVKINRTGNVKAELWKLSDRVASLFSTEGGSRMCYMADIVTGGEHKIRQKSWYTSSVLMDFENIKLAVPIGYNQLLKTVYRDYARIIRGGSTHNYPVYKKLDPDNRYMEIHQDISGTPSCKEKADYNTGKVLFLIRDAEKWVYYQELYAEELRIHNEIKVIVLPYRYKDSLQNTLDNFIYEAGLLSKDLPIANPLDYDIMSELPERVYIQDPFDSCSISTETDASFFTTSIRPYTKELILVIPYDAKVTGKNDHMENEMFRSYLDTPGCRLSDKILVFNEGMKELFSDCSGIADKIILRSIGAPAKEHPAKKTILFSDDISHFIGHEDAFIDKYSSIIKAFEDNTKKLQVYWYLSISTASALNILSDNTRDIYLATLNELIAADWCTVIENASDEELENLINSIDAVYGAPGIIPTKCLARNIPVMIWDIDVN